MAGLNNPSSSPGFSPDTHCNRPAQCFFINCNFSYRSFSFVEWLNIIRHNNCTISLHQPPSQMQIQLRFSRRKNLFLLITGLFFSLLLPAQNFLPNGDFENYSSCPKSMHTIEDGVLIDWYQPIKDCTPDYFNVCGTELCSQVPYNTMGYQQPGSGKGYIGFWAYIPFTGAAYSREFIACQLKSPLEKGKEYTLKLNLSLANNSCWSLSSIGVAFTSFYPTAQMPAEFLLLKHYQYDAGKQLSDTASWMPVEFTFTATGDENYFVLGNFDFSNKNAKKLPYKPEKTSFWHACYYYVDDVSCEEKKPSDTLAVVIPPPIDSLAELKTAFHEKYAAAFSSGYVLTRVFFDVDKYDLKPESDLSLDSVVIFMNLYPEIKIEISGHTDSTATEPYNQVLSQNRAEEVKRYLISKGISASRMVPVGYASSRPLATNATIAGRSRNRRVEFRVLE
jgi:OOP family OmpA-OmpF porin